MTSAYLTKSFELIHPWVRFVMFFGIIVLSMMGIHPAVVSISLLSVFSFAVLTQGLTQALSKLRYQLPLIILISCINPLFSASGSTLLGRVGPFRIYLESLAFGFVMACLLISVLMWIESAFFVLSQDELLMLFAKRFPTFALMLSMTASLVPQLLKRGENLRELEKANTALSSYTKEQMSRGFIFENIQGTGLISRLSTWAFEDSLDRADSMRSRGWGAGLSRRNFDARPLRRYDWRWLGALCVCFTLALIAELRLLETWNFYPRMEGSISFFELLPILCLMSLPSLLVLKNQLMMERLTKEGFGDKKLPRTNLSSRDRSFVEGTDHAQ